MPDNFEYFDLEPLQVPEYLKCFVTDPRKVTSGPALALCIGTKATREHVFLAKDGESKCLDCSGILCCLCSITSDEELCCVSCFVKQASGVWRFREFIG